ncbi:DEAD/DEAH box helicase [Macellibacteroides fermentans]|uniref:DEAD/DEAH box helicase n=1 Tax=Macellibacteroides fermentans TaxID=879969 RepID=UPI00406BE98C
MKLLPYGTMLRFTANYAYTNHNFVIQNLHGQRINNHFLAPICILKNILQRGTPTQMSEYLQSSFGKIDDHHAFKVPLPLISKELPYWIHTIKGDEKKTYYPAKTFFYDVIPHYLPEYRYIQQLMLPEAFINEITQNDADDFIDQCVDFLLPQAKLIIEIDGQHHKQQDRTRISDIRRDKHLLANGFATVRINTNDLEKKNNRFTAKIEEIRKRLNVYSKSISLYRKPFENPDEVYDRNAFQLKLIPTAVVRFQLLILELIERGKLRCDAPLWKFNVLQRDVRNFINFAVEDTCLWLENICRLQRINFQKPVVEIKESFLEKDFQYVPDAVNIDFSLLKRWTDENKLNPETIVVRTDYYDYQRGKRDYGQLSVTDPVRYDILPYANGEDSNLLRFFLRNIFGLEDFKDGQLRIITNALSLQHTIGLLPTSGGKSLCYQLASLLQPSVSIVICPIKSLMYDQKYNLDKVLIDRTAYITSDLDAPTKNKMARNYALGRYLWIWISPERMQSEDFRFDLAALNKNLTFCYAVIDEVHCLSEWGHDFRTSYLNLAKTIDRYLPSSTILGLTATATINVLKDIQTEFGIPNEQVKTLTNYSRPELEFKVVDAPGEKYEATLSILRQLDADNQILQLKGEDTCCGLIFTPNVNGGHGCYTIANKLSAAIKADVRWYSGEVPKKKVSGYKMPVMKNKEFDSYKIRTQKEFHENMFPMLVATKAFGMGVNKKNIHYTIHYGIPGSMESLYQEAGRAGRDGKSSQCYVVFSPEAISKEKLDIIFGFDTGLKAIREITEEIGWNGRDVFRNLYLWFSQQQDLEDELNLIRKIMSHCPPNSLQIIDAADFIQDDNAVGSIRVLVEKAIYRLSILGIVNDWTIVDWFRGIFKVEVNNYDRKSIKNHLVTYIRKYDPPYTYEEAISRYQKRGEMEQIILALLQWIYDHFAYNRRQSIKNVYELCTEFATKGNVWFKQELESMFNFSDVSYSLDDIAENPTDYEKWFAIFYPDSGTDLKRMISVESIHAIKSSLSRFLESYQYNTGLNLISGLIRLILGDFNNADGKPRMLSALKQIVGMDESEKHEILFKLLEIGNKLKKPQKNELGAVLTNYFKGKEEDIYEALEDDTSLTVLLDNANQRLVKVGSLLYDRCKETA